MMDAARRSNGKLGATESSEQAGEGEDHADGEASRGWASCQYK